MKQVVTFRDPRSRPLEHTHFRSGPSPRFVDSSFEIAPGFTLEHSISSLQKKSPMHLHLLAGLAGVFSLIIALLLPPSLALGAA